MLSVESTWNENVLMRCSLNLASEMDMHCSALQFLAEESGCSITRLKTQRNGPIICRR